MIRYALLFTEIGSGVVANPKARLALAAPLGIFTVFAVFSYASDTIVRLAVRVSDICCKGP